MGQTRPVRGQLVAFDIPKPMRCVPRCPFVFWFIAGLFALVVAAATPPCTAQAPDTFRWIDFHSPKDEDVIIWVTRALDGEKWTAIREIGVQYDAALVITTL